MMLRSILFALAGSAFLPVSEEDAIHFSRDIKPILSDKCFACHGPDRGAAENDLRLDVRELALEAAIVPGDPENSELIYRITSPDRFERMPPTWSKKPALTEDEIDRLRQWVEAGAPYEPHWSYVRPVRPEVPSVEDTTWPRNEIDRFVLARLEEEGLSPSPEADRITLIRRLSFDLLGLPPEPKDVEAFLRDDEPGAYERLVDRLLASPHYGERMAQHWLDLVRYADSAGYHSDPTVSVWPYRDYVIRAFNENKPFDQFTLEQIAGDLLPGSTLEQRVGATYNRLNKTTDEGGAQAGEYLAKSFADRVRTTGSVWMGATLGCVECHAHKFDPYEHRDFYRFGAFFADLEERGVYPNNSRPPFLTLPSEDAQQELARLDEAIESARSSLEENETPEAKSRASELKKRRDMLWKQQPTTLATVSVKPRTIRVLPRGNWLDESGEVVEPGVPSFLPPLDVPEGRRPTRLDLARWLVSPDHPLTARVFVNRLWALFFGKGISARLDDLGSQGEWPKHPALLDWLATELIRSGWNVQHMVRLMVLSQAYRQSSLPRDDLAMADPGNRLLARQTRGRIDAEFVRDVALKVSGLWNPEIGGPSVKPYQPEGYWSFLNFPTRTYRASKGDDQYRRGLYTHWQRTLLHPYLLAFDAPTREECVAERPVSNSPAQALVLLNDPSFYEAAVAFASRLTADPEATDEQRLIEGFRRVTSRRPEAEELALLKELLDTERRAGGDESDRAAWIAVARTLLNLGEAYTRN
ncbi:MAG: PSD1 and planctomycete cytochrome C domain-containing protein [Planctomycetota bacterium]